MLEWAKIIGKAMESTRSKPKSSRNQSEIKPNPTKIEAKSSQIKSNPNQIEAESNQNQNQILGNPGRNPNENLGNHRIRNPGILNPREVPRILGPPRRSLRVAMGGGLLCPFWSRCLCHGGLQSTLPPWPREGEVLGTKEVLGFY